MRTTGAGHGVAVGVAVGVVAIVVAAAVLLLPQLDLTDEWWCSDGQAPALHRSGGAACFPEGSTLPAGYRWDRWGNRPLASSCDEDGWVPVTDRTDDRADCVREGTDLPAGWHRVGSS